jgi:hypothetical protein
MWICPFSFCFQISGGKAPSFVFLCLALFLCNSNSVLLGLVISFIPDLGFVESNALIGSPLLVTAALSIPSSMAARRFGARFVVVALAFACALALGSIALVLRFSTVPSYAALFVLGALVGAGRREESKFDCCFKQRNRWRDFECGLVCHHELVSRASSRTCSWGVLLCLRNWSSCFGLLFCCVCDVAHSVLAVCVAGLSLCVGGRVVRTVCAR